MTDGTADSAADTMSERADESRLKLWLLLDADRRVLTAAATAAVFVGFVVAVSALGPPFADQLAAFRDRAPALVDAITAVQS